MGKIRVRVTTVEEFMMENGPASYVVDLVNKTGETYTEAGWSLEDVGEKYTTSSKAEMVPHE